MANALCISRQKLKYLYALKFHFVFTTSNTKYISLALSITFMSELSLIQFQSSLNLSFDIFTTRIITRLAMRTLALCNTSWKRTNFSDCHNMLRYTLIPQILRSIYNKTSKSTAYICTCILNINHSQVTTTV